MLQSKKLSKKYNGKIALDHVDVELLDGKIYALLGPNGSGKTTFMKILSSLTRESEGEVTLDGEALSMKSTCCLPSYGVSCVSVYDSRRVWRVL